ncbi:MULTISPECIES: HNH endonuclease [Paenibacillus]|uniref:HNH endonuclease n=1 Tax=Paenibacillus TaxID=44249 RepID=UPI0015C33AF2|nr:HNH endonuclease [Paenibacillus odorifer]
MAHQTFWKPEKKTKEKKTSSLGHHKKVKKEVPEWKKNLLADHKPGKNSSQRNEFPDSVVKAAIERSKGICQFCKRVRCETTHHVFGRGRGGRGVLSNAYRACGNCHIIIEANDELKSAIIEEHRILYGEYFWFDEQDWNEHNHKLNKQLELEKARDERLQQIEPIADLIATAAGRELRAKELRLLESFETKDLNIFTAMFTDALNGYAAQGS